MKWIQTIKAHYLQLLFVIAAFSLMVVVSYYYTKNIVEEQIEIYGEEMMNSTEANVKFTLAKSEIAMNNAVFSIENIIANNAPQSMALNFITRWTDLLRTENDTIVRSVYGVVRGEYMDGYFWEPPEDWIPESRPWYTCAVEKKGNICYTDLYVDAETGGIVMSLSKLILDRKGNQAGVLAIDISITALANYLETLKLTNNSYSVLLNEKMVVAAHRVDSLIGKPFDRINGRENATLIKRIRNNDNISAENFLNYDKTQCIIFFRHLFNGWHIGIITPVEQYHKQIQRMALVLFFVGLFFTVILCYILLFLFMAKSKADTANQSKSIFLAKVSHEIRTPMNAIIGMSELILREPISPRVRDHIQNIKQAGGNLLSLINDILDFSKMESGKFELANGYYFFSSLINDVINIVRVRIVDKPILFVTYIDSRIPNKLMGDSSRIRQILLNLLTNAIKYTKEGSISLAVRVQPEGGGTVLLSFDIIDTGVGIPPEMIEKLFGDFVQIDTIKNKGIEGTGLGLAITQNLCKAMGGDISVESEYGKGSRFTVRIPQTFDRFEEYARVKNPKEKKVLLYETQETYVDSITFTLKNLGVDCVVVKEIADFEREIKLNYPFVFLSSHLYEKAKSFESNSEFIILGEPGEINSSQQIRLITLPVVPTSVANVLNHIAEESHHQESSVNFKAPTARVMIVDDIDINLKIAEGLMQPYEMAIDVCTSGKECLELLKKNEHVYDIIFMDHMMPEMDGIETALKIRLLDSEDDYFKKIPIVALTANAISGIREIFLQNGMSDFLAKPIEMSKLNSILEIWIPESKQIRRSSH